METETTERAATERPVEPRAATDGELGSQFGRVATDVQTLFDRVVALATLEWKRLRMRAVDRSLQVAAALLLLVAAAAIAVGAGVLVVTGARDGLARWSGETWVGELGGGVLLLGVVALGAGVVRGAVRRRLVADAVRPKQEPPG
jgi:hypothetical protein